MFISEKIISIFIGIITGIITAVILWFASIFWKKVLLPWFQEFVYKGVNVSGNWIYEKEEQVSPTNNRTIEISLDIQQKAHEVFGTFRAKNKYTEDPKEYINYYKIIGLVKDNYLLFSYSAQRKDRTGVGSFLLRVSRGGTQLTGSAIFTPDASVEDSRVAIRKDMVFKRN